MQSDGGEGRWGALSTSAVLPGLDKEQLRLLRRVGREVRAGQSSEKAALICQHSDLERQQAVASGLDDLVRSAREKAVEKPSGADLVRDT